MMCDELGYRRFCNSGKWHGRWCDHRNGLIHLILWRTSPQRRQPLAWRAPPQYLSEVENEFITKVQIFQQREFAYAMLQFTRPQTLAYGMNDSPVGLAAWIVEKFRAWSDCQGNIEMLFSKDELLTNLTIYWVTETINSSIRLYYLNLTEPTN